MHSPHLHRTEAHDEAELIEGLEPDQLEVNASQPLPRMALSRGWTLGFWALRLFVLLITVLVVVVFIADLG